MFVRRVINISSVNRLQKTLQLSQKQQHIQLNQIRFKTHHKSGAIRPMPKILPFGFAGLIGSVIPGLFIGAAISKSVANFLEENDLFVPSDDDDDED